MLLTCVIPAHNEGGSIRATLREIDSAAAGRIPPVSGVQVFVSEDGSRDQTREEVAAAANDASHCRIKLSGSGPRLGYSRAVLRGLSEADGDIVWFMDADGQYDPQEVWSLLPKLSPGSIVVGYRNPRMDSTVRRAYSSTFRLAYRLFGGPKLKDPSSPFVLANRSDLLFLLKTSPHLEYGFWWEFQTRCAASGLAIVEMPISHRVRSSGETQVYKLSRLPAIVLSHLRGLARLRQELRHG